MHWDFALILIFFAAAAPWMGRRRIRRLLGEPATTREQRLALYISTVAFQWAFTGVVLWRAEAHRIPLAKLGVSVPNPLLVTVVSILLGGAILANQIFSLQRLATHPAELHGTLGQMALKIFPQDRIERIMFLPLVVTAALCEEFVFRGFIQHVFEDWSGGSVLAGIAGSSILFAAAHLYQGRRGVASTFLAGCLFSAVRAWTGSLLPVICAHFIADLVAGMLAPARVRSAQAEAREALSVQSVG